jgi:hypothetical protein
MEDEALAEWREKVDDFLCKTVIAGGTECWTSKICSAWVENEPQGGLMYTETSSGTLDIAVHVEGQKDPLIYDEGAGQTSEFLYKLTYVVKNPSKKPLTFNVVVEGEQRTARLYDKDVVVDPGSQSTRMGNSAIVQYSNFDYKRVCIRFGMKPQSLDIPNEVCNMINVGAQKKITAKLLKVKGIRYKSTAETKTAAGDLEVGI